jgi:hypothetical protein
MAKKRSNMDVHPKVWLKGRAEALADKRTGYNIGERI